MTAFLLVAGVVVMVMVVAGLWTMEHAGTEPAARSIGTAPDSTEEDEVRARAVRPTGVLADAPRD